MSRKDFLNLDDRQKRTYDRCYVEARDYFNLPEGWVLHHKDTDLQNTDIERYIRWLPEDLVPMTKSDHMRLHANLNNPMNNPESRKKIGLKNKGKNPAKVMKERNPEGYENKCRKQSETMKKRHWFNNGVKCVFTEECPANYKPGRLKKWTLN